MEFLLGGVIVCCLSENVAYRYPHWNRGKIMKREILVLWMERL